MPELTLESIAKRVAELERRLNAQTAGPIPARHDWRQVVGISAPTEFSRQLIAKMESSREADRREAAAEAAADR